MVFDSCFAVRNGCPEILELTNEVQNQTRIKTNQTRLKTWQSDRTLKREAKSRGGAEINTLSFNRHGFIITSLTLVAFDADGKPTREH